MDKLVIEQAQRAIIQGDSAKARKILAEELVTDPRNEQLWLLLSQVVPPEKVKETLERVLKINPDNQEAIEKLSALTPRPDAVENTIQEEKETAKPEIPIQELAKVRNLTEGVTLLAPDKEQHHLPITISEDEFEALFKESANAVKEDDKEPLNLGVSREVLDEFNKQTDYDHEVPASSLDITEEELEALFNKSSSDINEEQKAVNFEESKESINGLENIPVSTEPPPASSLEVTEEELEALFKKIEQRSHRNKVASESYGSSEVNIDQETEMDASNIEMDNLLNIGEYPDQTEQDTFAQKKEFQIGLEDIIPQKNGVSVIDIDLQQKSPDVILMEDENQTDEGLEPVTQTSEEEIAELNLPVVQEEPGIEQEKPVEVDETAVPTTPILLPETIRIPQTREKVYSTKRLKPKPKGLPKWLIALILIPLVSCILMIAGFLWYYFYGPCGVESVATSTEYLLRTQKRWDDSLVLATNSSRVVLTEPLVKLEDIRQELIDTKVPSCMQSAKDNLQNSMQATIEAYVSFLQYVGEDAIRDKFNVALNERSEYERKIQLIQNCAPFCTLLSTTQ